MKATDRYYSRLSVHIIAVVAMQYHLRPSDITGSCREARFVWPRHVAVHLVRKHTNFSLPTIARLFNFAHHTSVIHALSAVANRIDTDPVKADELETAERHSRSSAININTKKH
jgi:chromosomal replication initiator protein